MYFNLKDEPEGAEYSSSKAQTNVDYKNIQPRVYDSYILQDNSFNVSS